MAKRMRKTRRKVSIRNKIGATVRGRIMAAKLGPTAGYEGYETVTEMVDVADKPEPKGRARKTAKVTASKAEKLTPTQFAKKWKAERTKAVAGDKQAAKNLAQLRKTGIEQGILSPDGKRLNSHSDKKKAARAAKTEAKTRRAHNRAAASIDDIHAARADKRPRDYWESVDAETMRKEQSAKEEIDSLRDLDEKGIAELRESTAAQMKEIVNKINYGQATAADENELDELTHFAYALDAATLRENGFDPFDPDNTPEWTLTENFSALNDQDLQRIENNPYLPGWQRDLASEELEHRQPWRDGGILQSMLKDASITELRATQAMFMGDDAQYTNAELRQLAAKTGNARYAYDADTFDADYAAWLENVTGEKLDPETFKKLNAIGGKPTPEQQAIIDKLGYIPNRANYARTLRDEPVNTTTGKPRTHRDGQPEPDGYDNNLEALYGKDAINATADEINSIQAMDTDQVETELAAAINNLKAWGHPPQFADVHDEYQFDRALHHAFMLDAEAHARRNQHADTGEPNPFHDEPPAFGDATADNFDPFDDALLAETERARLAEIDSDELEALAADASTTGNTQYSDFIWDELQRRNPEIEGGEIDQALPYAGIRELTALYKKWAPDTPIDNAFKERVKEQAARRGNERYRNHPAAQEEYDNWLESVLNVDDGKGGKINIRDGLYMGDKTDPNGGGLYKDANGNFKPVTLSFEEAITNDMMAVQLGEEISRAIEENIGFLPNQTNFMKMVRGERPKQFRYSPDERRDMATMGGRKSRPKTVKEKLDKENAEAQNTSTTNTPDTTDKPRKATPDATETPEATNLKKRLEEATRAENQRHKDNAEARKQQGATEVQEGEQLKENGEIVRDAAIIYPRDNGTYAVKPYTPTGQGDKRAPNGKGHPAKNIEEARELADTITAMVGMSDADIRAAIDGDDKRRAEMAIAERDRRAALNKADGKTTDAKATAGKARANKPAPPNKDTEKARTTAAKRTTTKRATAKPQAKKETTGNKETTAKPAKDNDVMAAMTNENTGRISRKADLTKFTDKQLENTEKALRAENPTDPKQQRDQASALRHIDREKSRRWAAKADKEKAKREAAKPKAQREREAREREAHENVLVAIAHKNPQGRWVKNHSADQRKNLQRLDEKTLTDAINHNETGRTAGEVKDAAKKELARRERLRKNADKPAPKRPKGVPEKGIEDATDKELINFLRYAQRLERWMEAHKRAGTDNTDDYVDQLDGRGHDVTEASEVKRELKRRGYALNNLNAGRQDGSNEADMFAERKAEKERQAQRDKKLAKARAATKRAAEHKKKLLNGEPLEDITDKELQGYNEQFRGDEPNFNSLKGEARDTARNEYRTLKAAVNDEMIKRGLRQDPNEEDGKKPATPAKPAVKPVSQAERNKTAKLDAALRAAMREDTTGNAEKQAHKLVADRLGISGATTQEDFTKRVNEYIDANGELTTLEEDAIIYYAIDNKLSSRAENGMPIYFRDNDERTAEEERRLARAVNGRSTRAWKTPTGTRELSVDHRPTKAEIAEAIRTLNAKPETKEVKKPTPTPATPTDGVKPVVNEFTPTKGRDKGKKRLYINNIDEIIRDDSTKRAAPYRQDSNLKAWVDEDGIVHIDDRRTYVADIGGDTHKDLKEYLQTLLSDAVGRGLVDRHGNEVTPGKPAVRKVSEGTPLPEGDKSLPATPAPESAPKEQPEAPVTVNPVTPPTNTEDAKKLRSIAVKDGDTARIVRAQTNNKKTQDNPEELKRLLKIAHETETKSLENLIALSEYLKTHPEERKEYPFARMRLVTDAQAAREQLANRQRMEWAAKVDGENIISRPDKPRELKHWPGVNTTSPHDEDLVITHEPGEGTMIRGTSRGDGTAAILKKNGWKWSRNLRAWYIPNSRDSRPNMRKINATSRDLMAEGHNSIGHDITNELEDALTRRAGKAQRLSDRADALEEKAKRKAAKAKQAWQRHEELSRQVPPYGEPIKVDHYSAPRHRRAIEKAWDSLGRSVQANKEAQEVHRRAGIARANALNRDKSPEYLRNRIEERKAAMRAAERDLMGTNKDGRPPVTGEAREIALENYFDAIDEIDALRALLQEVDPNALTETLENTDGIEVGDTVKIGKEQGTVLKVTPKTVTIRYRGKWSNAEMERRVNINTITAHIPADEETRKAIQTENTAKAAKTEGTSPSITQRILKRHAIEGEKFDRNGIIRNGIKIKSSTSGLGTYMFEGPGGTTIKLVPASAGIGEGPRNLDDARVIADRIAEDLKLDPKFARNQYVGESDERLEEAYTYGLWGASELYKARREARENNPAKEGDTPKGKSGKQPAKNIIDTGERGAWSRRTGKEQTKQDKEALEYQPTPQQLDPNNPGIYVNKAGYWGTPETISPGTEEPWADEPGGWRPGMVPAAILVQKDGKNYNIDLVKNQGNKFIVTGTEVDTGEKLTMTADLFGNTGETYTLRFDPEYEGIYSTADFPTP